MYTEVLYRHYRADLIIYVFYTVFYTINLVYIK